jgi:hypothetical protein
MNRDITVARKLGWPLTAQDIIQERVEFEDRFLHRHVKVEHDPEVMRKELPSGVWTPTVRHVFGGSLIRYAESIMP